MFDGFTMCWVWYAMLGMTDSLRPGASSGPAPIA